MGTKNFVLLLCTCFVWTTKTFIYEIRVLRAWVPQHQQFQHVICLSDYHDRSLPENAEQRSSVLKKIGCCKPCDTKIVVEDLSSANASGNCGCCRFSLTSKTGLLASMAQECQKRGIEVENVEYRYCRVIALGPVLYNINADPQTIQTAQDIGVADLLREIEQAMREVKAYNYDTKLTAMVQQNVDYITKELNYLDIFKYATKSVGHYLAHRTWQTNRLAILKKLLTVDSPLLDLKVVNAVLRAQNKKSVIILAGGTHINHATDLLKHNGYEVIHQTKRIRHEQMSCWF